MVFLLNSKEFSSLTFGDWEFNKKIIPFRVAHSSTIGAKINVKKTIKIYPNVLLLKLLIFFWFSGLTSELTNNEKIIFKKKAKTMPRIIIKVCILILLVILVLSFLVFLCGKIKFKNLFAGMVQNLKKYQIIKIYKIIWKNVPSKFNRNNTCWLEKKIPNIPDIIGAITNGMRILLETQNNGKIIAPVLIKKVGHFDNNKKKPTIINKPVARRKRTW